MADGTSATSLVLLREYEAGQGLRIGHATLNAEKSINALSLAMVRELDRALIAWAADPGIACVVLDGAGEKGFCAGGDVRFLRDAALSHRGPGPSPEAEAFFSEEYRLDHRIHTYPKPILVWGGGIVMGGGLGLLAGASHRVVTETSRIAMPEITIGLFPDVGGSWFLPRMPGRTGLFLALTGAAMNAGDALHVGLADHLLRSADRAAVLDRLTTIGLTGRAGADRDTLSSLLTAFSHKAETLSPASKIAEHQAHIELVTAGQSLPTVHAAICSYAGADAWLQRAAKSLAGGSPTSTALVWELYQRARHLSLAEVFRLELIVALQCCAHPDFPEGVRALLIDKDNVPRWMPATLAEVSGDWIAEHFTAPWSAWANEVHPLADL